MVEIVSIGNELLMGKISDANARWIAKRATTLGLSVNRIVTVTDDIDEISSEVREAIQRNPRFIITTGGLGPTFDDKTLEGIAKGTGRKLELSDQALKKIEEKYRRQIRVKLGDQELKRIEKRIKTRSLKMGTIPKGSHIFLNPAIMEGGLGVLMELDGTTLIALPGVPQEVKAILEELVVPLFRQAAGNLTFFEATLEVEGMWEAVLAPLIDQVMLENPHIYIKSLFHPVEGSERFPHIELHLSTTNEDSNLAENWVNKALIQISELIREKGGKINPPKTKS
jgi:molybdenum cofactor synthesis domain-containing protein